MALSKRKKAGRSFAHVTALLDETHVQSDVLPTIPKKALRRNEPFSSSQKNSSAENFSAAPERKSVKRKIIFQMDSSFIEESSEKKLTQENLLAETTTRKKARKKSDGAYARRVPRSRHSNSQENIPSVWFMRSDATKTVIHEGKEEEIRTSVQLNVNALGISEKTAEKINSKFVSISTHTPTKLVPSNNTGSSKKVRNRSGKILNLRGSCGALDFYSTQSPKKSPAPCEKLETNHSFFSSSPYRNVKRNKHIIKTHKVHLTSEFLKEVARECRRNNYQRACSQNKPMANDGVNETKASAGKYAAAIDLFFNTIGFEWVHLLAHRLAGNRAQHSDNLACGSKPMNTSMIPVEAMIEDICKAFPDGIFLEMTAEYVPKTQLLKKLDYVITANNLRLPFQFSGQQCTRPHVSHYQYIKIFIEEMIKIAKADEGAYVLCARKG